MAAEYLRVKTELADLRQYKTQLTDKIKKNQEVESVATPTQEEVIQYTQLKSEKVENATSFVCWFRQTKWSLLSKYFK